MKMGKWKWAGVAAAVGMSCAAQAVELIPVQDFVKHPTYSSVKISPNGEYLAMTVDRGDQDVLTVLRTKDLSIVKINTAGRKERRQFLLDLAGSPAVQLDQEDRQLCAAVRQR